MGAWDRPDKIKVYGGSTGCRNNKRYGGGAASDLNDYDEKHKPKESMLKKLIECFKKKK